MNGFLKPFALTALIAALAQPALAQKNPLPERHVVGRVLVQPRVGLSLAEFDKILKAHGGRNEKIIKKANIHIVALPPQANAVAIASAPSER